MDKEIFRYSFNNWSILGYASEHEDAVLPKGWEGEKSYWISVLISNKSVKKHGRNFDNSFHTYNDGRLDKIPGASVGVLYDLIDLFKKWVEKDKPKFLSIGAYHDISHEKQKQRYFLYDRVLAKLGYKIYYVEKIEDIHVFYYHRKDLPIKSKTLSVGKYFEDLYGKHTKIKDNRWEAPCSM